MSTFLLLIVSLPYHFTRIEPTFTDLTKVTLILEGEVQTRREEVIGHKQM